MMTRPWPWTFFQGCYAGGPLCYNVLCEGNRCFLSMPTPRNASCSRKLCRDEENEWPPCTPK